MMAVCPSCGYRGGIEVFVSEADAKRCATLWGELPALIGQRIPHYFALFRNPTGRGLKWYRARSLTESLMAMARESHIQWGNSVARPNSVHVWADAMDRIIHQPPKRLPLTSHGYLKRIAYDLADEADRAVEKEHIRREQTGRARPADDRGAEGFQRIDPDMLRKIRDQKGV